MLEYRMRFIALAVVTVITALPTVLADTWHLGKEQDWEPISAEGEGKFLLAVAQTKKLVNTGQIEAARKAFDKLKEDFPEIAGPDLDLFIEAELLFCKGKLTTAIRSHDKLLTEYPQSELRKVAIDRQFAIAIACLTGQKKTVLGVFKMKRYAEGVRVMERITDRAGFDSPIGVAAAITVAKHYERRAKFNEAYLKWWDISSQRQTGQIGKDALLGMARCKHAAYNKNPEHKRPFYDASNLRTTKSSYEKFQLQYPKDAEEIGIDEILNQIDEQLAYKQLTIGRYYQRIDNRQSANLYYNMVISNWPHSKAAKIAKEMLTENLRTEETKK